MYVDSLSRTVLLRYMHSSCAAILVCDLGAEQCIAEKLVVERVSAGDQAMASSCLYCRERYSSPHMHAVVALAN